VVASGRVVVGVDDVIGIVDGVVAVVGVCVFVDSVVVGVVDVVVVYDSGFVKVAVNCAGIGGVVVRGVDRSVVGCCVYM